MNEKLTVVRGRVSTLEQSCNGATRVAINVGEYSTLSETPASGTIYIDGQPSGEWQLGQTVTITIER